MARIVQSTNQLSSPAWAGDWLDREHLVPGGARVDPAQFNATDASVVTVGAGAAAGATSVTVGALPAAIPAGTILNFGTLAPVTVTVNDASISAGETTFTVTALSGPIPSGTTLDFSAGTNAQLAKLSADAAAAATTLTVFPLDGTIANTQTALFPGGTKQARLTADAAAGATTLTVDELQFALATSDTATYSGTTGVKLIPSGTPIGRTIAERDAGTAYGPALSTDDEIFLVAFDVTDAALNADVELYRGGSIVKETFVPGWAGLAAALKTAIRAKYQCTVGAA